MDGFVGVDDGVAGGGAGGGGGADGAFETPLDGEVAGGGVDHEFGDGEGGDAADAFGAEDIVFLFHGGDAADAGADDDAGAVGVFPGEVETGVFDGMDAGDDAVD